MEINLNLELILKLLDALGIIAFSFGGFIVAKRKKLDILGVYIICITSSLTGGIIKDIILNKTPFIFTSSYPIASSLIVSSILLLIHKKIKIYETIKIFLISDAIGLSAFSVIGALQGIEYNLNIFGIVFLGMITAVGGGVVRDVLLQNIPLILKEDFYGMVALIVSLLIYILFIINRLFYFEIIFVIFIGVVIRIIAIKKGLYLPKL
jgi:uncharacterized membrane protein YeiH